MSRQKIAAATLVVVALGAGLTGYIQATSVNDRERELTPESGSAAITVGQGYRQNHQLGHSGADFTWLESLFATTKVHDSSKELDASDQSNDPVAAEVTDMHEKFTDIPLPSGGSGALASNAGGEGFGDSSFSGSRGFDFIGARPAPRGGGGGKAPSSGAAHDSPPLADSKPGESGANQDEPTTDAPQGTTEPETPVKPQYPTDTETGTNYPDLPPLDDTQKEVHSVPEPGTLGLIAIGLAAAAWRRRRS